MHHTSISGLRPFTDLTCLEGDPPLGTLYRPWVPRRGRGRCQHDAHSFLSVGMSVACPPASARCCSHSHSSTPVLSLFLMLKTLPSKKNICAWKTIAIARYTAPTTKSAIPPEPEPESDRLTTTCIGFQLQLQLLPLSVLHQLQYIAEHLSFFPNSPVKLRIQRHSTPPCLHAGSPFSLNIDIPESLLHLSLCSPVYSPSEAFTISYQASARPSEHLPPQAPHLHCSQQHAGRKPHTPSKFFPNTSQTQRQTLHYGDPCTCCLPLCTLLGLRLACATPIPLIFLPIRRTSTLTQHSGSSSAPHAQITLPPPLPHLTQSHPPLHILLSTDFTYPALGVARNNRSQS
ncbi:hypothetical protein B0H34DRAFT_714078 [Crassisporium funariophilum]|nr:hypothetical protein B0H34DRAFT_714078 [Crassisporium funariophilum]